MARQPSAEKESLPPEPSSALLRGALDALTARLCMLDAQGRILEINRAWAEHRAEVGTLTSFDVGADYVSACERDRFPSNDAVLAGQDLARGISQVLKGAAPRYVAEYPSRVGAERRWFQVHVDPIRDSDRAAALVAHYDITDRVLATERLARAAEDSTLLALVAAHTDNSVVITDVNARIVWVNRGFTRLTGYELEEVVGKVPGSILQGPATDPETVAYMRRQIRAQEGFEVEILNYHKTGRPYWISSEVRPVRGPDGCVSRFIAIQSDATKRRADAEEMQRQHERTEALARALEREKAVLLGIISTIPHAVFWKDRESRYLGCNDTFCRLAGMERSEDLVGKTDQDCPWRAQAADYVRDDREVIESGEPKLDIEEELDRADGRTSVILTSKVPLRNADGEVEGVLGVFADITEMKDLERELAQARKLESIGQLAAGIAHEINTPTQYVSDNTHFVAGAFQRLLPPMRGFAELESAHPEAAPPREELAPLWKALRDANFAFASAEIPKALEQSQEGLDRIAGIVRAMKEFSHPGDERSATDLNAAIQSTIVVARHEWKYVADVETDLDPSLGPVTCHAGDIKQVVLNMIVNAAHAIEKARGQGAAAKGHIRISTRSATPWAELRIADDGCGIAPEHRSRIFDPFFTTKEVGKGTGQGLTIARAIVVKKHRGTIDVETEVGQGTTFIVRIPLERAPSGDLLADAAPGTT
ncbi:MAG: PAS domain-containing protein [bacterium]